MELEKAAKKDICIKKREKNVDEIDTERKTLLCFCRLRFICSRTFNQSLKEKIECQKIKYHEIKHQKNTYEKNQILEDQITKIKQHDNGNKIYENDPKTPIH